MKFYESLEPLLPPSLHIFRTIFKEHREIVSLCGNFPHRDHYYNRTTSAIGKSLMENPEAHFDPPLCEGEDGEVFFGHDPSKLWQTTQRAFDVIDRFDALVNHSARRRSIIPTNYMTKQRITEFAELFRIFGERPLPCVIKDGRALFQRSTSSRTRSLVFGRGKSPASVERISLIIQCT
jgi:hypothetical protein